MKNPFERVIGIILLIPPVIRVLLFLLGQFGANVDIDGLTKPDFRSGSFSSDAEGDYMSPIPIYLGLMAIGGAILLKGSGETNK